MNTKICIKCNQSKSMEDFYTHALSKDGRTPQCKECLKSYARQYQKDNKEKCLTYIKKWKQDNKEKNRLYVKTWAQRNPEKRREIKRKCDRKAMLNPLHRLSNNVRGNMYQALKGKKAGRKWETLVGYTLQDLINHIDPMLNKTMTWENYGNTWHVDHIIPKSWFKYTSTDDPKFKECWALSNLQPKLKLDNSKKGNRFIG